MKKSLLLLVTLVSSFAMSTLTLAKEDAAAQPIHNMFDAMREHNGNKLLAQFTDNAILQRAGKGGEVKTNDLKKFAAFVSKTDKHLDEKLLAVNVAISDNLASVWTPYVFYLDGKLSHCGVNSFQLVKFEYDWKIVYLIDNTHAGDCEKFIARYSEN